MTGGTGKRTLRRAVWWSAGSRLSLALVLALCASAGIRIPAQDIAAARVERRSARGKLATVDASGCAELSQGGQTTVTVQPTRPVTFTRPPGNPACARTVRYYAADPAAAAIRVRVPALQTTP